MRIRNYVRRFYRELMPLLYGRTNYKLFMTRTFRTLDERIRSILCASNVLPSIIRPIPIKAPFGKSMLVVAPHQDDEIIGCGGAMALQIKRGKKVTVVFTQDGGDGYEAAGISREEAVSIREGEALSVARQLGAANPKFLRYANLNTKIIDVLAKDLIAEIECVKADVIFTPFFLDYNEHHQITNYALAEALSQSTMQPKIYGYEVWGLTIPNVIINIDSVMTAKRQLLSLYKSQLKGKDYLNGITGLNMYHSMVFGTGECSYAERFFEMPAVEFINVIKDIRKGSNI